jgi:hypothetical protein
VLGDVQQDAAPDDLVLRLEDAVLRRTGITIQSSEPP